MDGSVRAIYPGFELRAEGEGVRMRGHFAGFTQWTEIRSVFEGDLCERLAPGCFAKTFKERGSRIKVLFNHGRDPVVGDKVLGSINHLAENRRGASYEVDLLDTEYVRELLPALDPWPVRRVLPPQTAQGSRSTTSPSPATTTRAACLSARSPSARSASSGRSRSPPTKPRPLAGVALPTSLPSPTSRTPTA